MHINRSYQNYADEELLPLITGTSDAFNELYVRYAQKMFSYFFRMLWKNKELAEDCTQDLFVKIVRHAAGFEQTRSFSTWLYSIANNMCKNEYRKAEVRNKPSEMKIATITAAVDPDIRRFKEAVHNCTAKLTEEKKALFIMRFQEHLPVPEISEILGIPEGTVKSRIFYLLKEMKDQLKEFETIHIYP